MKERPILFSAPMVRALLDGSKTQTRRIMKRQPHEEWVPAGYVELHGFDKHGELTPDKVIGWGAVNEDGDEGYCCQHGRPGDRLWVRESGVRSLLAGIGDQRGLFRHDVPATPEAGQYWVERTSAPGASYNVQGCSRAAALLKESAKVTPSIHMPRWACRILLEIVSVRVERLNAISLGDICKEGLAKSIYEFKPATDGFRVWADLWESINGAGSWTLNPWVWVIEFKRVTP